MQPADRGARATRRLVFVLFSFVLFVGVLGAPLGAWAEESFDATVARGIAEYKRGEYPGSAATLTKAYAMQPKARLLFNIARAHEKAGNTADAIAYYHKYVDAPQGGEPALVARARESLAKLEAPPPPPVAPPLVDPPPPPPAVAPPVVTAPAPTPAPPPPPPAGEPASGRSSTVGLVVLGTGVAAVAVGGAIGIWANATANKEKHSTSPTDKPQLRDEAYTRATVADVTMAAGAAIAVGALVYLLWPRSSGNVRVGSPSSPSLLLELPL